jgi:hypothetical protein
MSNLSSINQTISQLTQAGAALCQQVERGQADSPLANHFIDLQQQLSQAPFQVSLIGLTVSARTDVLNWFGQSDYSFLSLQEAEQPGLLKIHLQERGYSLETASGDRYDYEQIDPFIDQLKQGDVIQQDDPESFFNAVSISLQSSSSQRANGLLFLLPRSTNNILKQPALFNQLVTQTNMMLVAAPADYQLLKADCEALKDLLHSLPALQLLITPAQNPGTEQTNENNWWWRHPFFNQAAIQLDLLFINEDKSTTLPDLYQNLDNPCRKALSGLHYANQTHQAVDSLADRLEQELRQNKASTGQLGRKIATLEENSGSNMNLRDDIYKIRSTLDEAIESLSKALRESDRKTTLPQGIIDVQVETLLEALEADDLEQEETYKAYKLTLKEQYLDHIKQSFRKMLKSLMTDDLVLLRDGLSVHQSELNQSLQALGYAQQSFELTAPDEHHLWLRLKEMIDVSVRYRGEMPKRGFLQRLGEGRKMVFMALMTMSIGGSMIGFNVRNARYIGVVFLLLFIGGVVFTYKSWKKEDATRLDKELDRVRDQLTNELKRKISEIQREKVNTFSAHLDDLRKKTHQSLEGVLQTLGSNQDIQLQKEKGQLKERQNHLDKRRQELTQLNSQLVPLTQQTSQLVTQCQADLKQCE